MTPEFQRQNRDFAAALKAAGKPVELIEAADYTHFDMMESVGNPYGPNGRAVLAMINLAAAVIVALLAAALAGCGDSFHGFGGPKPAQPAVVVDPNVYPSNYRQQIAMMLLTVLSDRTEFHGALIAPPALKPIAGSQYQHYVVCLQLDSHGEQKSKMVIYLAGSPTQFIDATPVQCGGAPYQPFPELDAAVPHK